MISSEPVRMKENRVNDFTVQIATINGSGSQSANQILVRTLFRMGIPVGGKNLFPSNIQGLPTWFTIRAHPEGFVGRKNEQDIVITLNPSTALSDQKFVSSNGLFLYNSECALPSHKMRSDIISISIPFRQLSQEATESVKARKLLQNMIYVGLIAQILQLKWEVLEQTVRDQLGNKAELIQSNLKAITIGLNWAKQNLPSEFLNKFTAKEVPEGNDQYVLIDGNTTAALGLIYGGCTFASWYPITPSSSVMENLAGFSQKWRKDKAGHSTLAIIQAEDELAAVAMALGAGWTGARAVTATSGPGLSLMAETAGLAYYAEIPLVIWEVQRAGPSTGLPTRTQQSDVLFAAKLSHGDSKHILLFPSNPEEHFSFGQVAFDLAETLQTLVIVMSDLDLGMNFHRSKKWPYPTQPYARGKVLSADELTLRGKFERYSDVDNDGRTYRTLPGTEHPLAAYFTRGTGHDEQSRYSEDPEVYRTNLDRLNKKWENAKKWVPQPQISQTHDTDSAILCYGSTDIIINEVLNLLAQQNLKMNSICLKSYPFPRSVEEFISQHQTIYVVEQNRDAQMKTLLTEEYPQYTTRFKSILCYDGWPITAHFVTQNIFPKKGI
ncbi:MAG: 2-oxoacid:acceptor oxidoreductase subunit alpha [Bdellovibrionales bacterium]|nr:2-oxoacid:acceptor oxidoreductase subunit alpha [Bdellovibrionales bacterium]